LPLNVQKQTANVLFGDGGPWRRGDSGFTTTVQTPEQKSHRAKSPNSIGPGSRARVRSGGVRRSGGTTVAIISDVASGTLASLTTDVSLTSMEKMRPTAAVPKAPPSPISTDLHPDL
jgi:hypothetical protein